MGERKRGQCPTLFEISSQATGLALSHLNPQDYIEPLSQLPPLFTKSAFAHMKSFRKLDEYRKSGKFQEEIDGFAMFQCMRREENNFRELFAKDRNNPAISDPHVGLVSIFSEFDQILPDLADKWSQTAPKLFAKSWSLPTPARPATVSSLAAFKRNFDTFSERQLSTIDWTGVLVAGGSVLASLTPFPTGQKKKDIRKQLLAKFGQSDIDMFLYGMTPRQANEKVKQIYEAIQEENPHPTLIVRSKHALTITSQYPFRNIQIVLRIYKNPAEILMGFDVDCCAVGFDGSQVWCTPRAARAIASQTNVVDPETRRSPTYEFRLIKYSKRGFAVIVPDLIKTCVNPLVYELRLLRSFRKGLAKLLFLDKYPSTSEERTWYNNLGYDDLERARDFQGETGKEPSDYSSVFVPWGPKWNSEKVKKLLEMQERNDEWDSNKHRHFSYVHEDMENVLAWQCNQQDSETEEGSDEYDSEGWATEEEEEEGTESDSDDENNENGVPKGWKMTPFPSEENPKPETQTQSSQTAASFLGKSSVGQSPQTTPTTPRDVESQPTSVQPPAPPSVSGDQLPPLEEDDSSEGEGEETKRSEEAQTVSAPLPSQQPPQASQIQTSSGAFPLASSSVPVPGQLYVPTTFPPALAQYSASAAFGGAYGRAIPLFSFGMPFNGGGASSAGGSSSSQPDPSIPPLFNFEALARGGGGVASSQDSGMNQLAEALVGELTSMLSGLSVSPGSSQGQSSPPPRQPGFLGFPEAFSSSPAPAPLFNFSSPQSNPVMAPPRFSPATASGSGSGSTPVSQNRSHDADVEYEHLGSGRNVPVQPNLQGVFQYLLENMQEIVTPGGMTEHEREEEDAKLRGPVTWLTENPGRQFIGSFHPLSGDDWDRQVYCRPPKNKLYKVSFSCSDLGGPDVSLTFFSEILSVFNIRADIRELRSLTSPPPRYGRINPILTAYVKYDKGMFVAKIPACTGSERSRAKQIVEKSGGRITFKSQGILVPYHPKYEPEPGSPEAAIMAAAVAKQKSSAQKKEKEKEKKDPKAWIHSVD